MMNNFFSKNLKHLRKKQGLTQQNLADVIGKKKSIVGNYEKGTVEASIETVQKLGDYFTVNWVNLLGIDFANPTPQDNNNDTNVATINELVGIRKENAQKDKKIEKLEAQIHKMSEEIKKLK